MFGKVAAADVIAKGVPMSEHPAIADVRRTNQASAAHQHHAALWSLGGSF